MNTDAEDEFIDEREMAEHERLLRLTCPTCGSRRGPGIRLSIPGGLCGDPWHGRAAEGS